MEDMKQRHELEKKLTMQKTPRAALGDNKEFQFGIGGGQDIDSEEEDEVEGGNDEGAVLQGGLTLGGLGEELNEEGFHWDDGGID